MQMTRWHVQSVSQRGYDITYTASRNPAAGMAATFNGTTSLIEIPNGDQLMNTDDFTLSVWVKADSTKHGSL